MSLPTLRQLQYLVAVVELRHFGQAAERCFVTQSTLSAGIQDLEALLGTPLLERTKRTVLPSVLGEEVAEQAREILTLSGDLVERVQAESAPYGGTVRLGLIPTIAPFLLPTVLPTLRAALPEADFLLQEGQSAELVRQVAVGELDIAILAFPYDVGSLAHSVAGEEAFLAVLPVGHSLAAQATLTPSQLPVADLLLLAEGHCLRDHALAACQLTPKANRASFQGTSLTTLIEMVASGAGLTLVPAMACNSALLKRDDICLRPLAQKGRAIPSRGIGLVWRQSYQRQALLTEISRVFTKELDRQADAC